MSGSSENAFQPNRFLIPPLDRFVVVCGEAILSVERKNGHSFQCDRSRLSAVIKCSLRSLPVCVGVWGSGNSSQQEDKLTRTNLVVHRFLTPSYEAWIQLLEAWWGT